MERPKISINKMYITAQWRPQEKKDDYYASATKTTHPREAEYIRKDALLEWLKEQEEIMKCGGRVLISDIISRIESL